MERLKPIQRNASAGAAAEQESYRPELVTDEEPRYLRRQKPVEIRRKKLGGKTWPFYRRVFVWTLVGGTLATGVVLAARFALYSPQMLLIKPDQISITGNHVVSREEVLKLFVHDRNRSVLRIPLDTRRTQLQEIPWVDEASVQRILPNHLRVEITERTPIAFFRNGTDLTLINRRMPRAHPVSSSTTPPCRTRVRSSMSPSSGYGPRTMSTSSAPSSRHRSPHPS